MRLGEAGRQVTASREESLDRKAERRVNGGEGARRGDGQGRTSGEVGPRGRRVSVGVACFGGVGVRVGVGRVICWMARCRNGTGMDVVGADASVFEQAVERRVDADGSGEGEAEAEDADEAAAKGLTEAPERREAVGQA